MSGAQRTIGSSSSQWDFHPWHRCEALSALTTFPDRHAAFCWLKQFRSDPVSMAILHSVVAEGGPGGSVSSRYGDDQVLEDLSWLLSRGVLHAHRVPPPRTAWRIAEEEADSAEAAAFPSRPVTPQAGAVSSPAKAVEELDTFSSQTDAAATAAVLRSAAADGLPFCEECAKAAAAARKAA